MDETFDILWPWVPKIRERQMLCQCLFVYKSAPLEDTN
jgi:hypothetical protein